MSKCGVTDLNRSGEYMKRVKKLTEEEGLLSVPGTARMGDMYRKSSSPSLVHLHFERQHSHSDHHCTDSWNLYECQLLFRIGPLFNYEYRNQTVWSCGPAIRAKRTVYTSYTADSLELVSD